MEIDTFITELQDKFYYKNTWLKSGHALQESVMTTIKSFLIKKNLVLISKSELDRMKYELSKNGISW